MRTILGCVVALLAGCSNGTPGVFGTVERDRLTLIAPVTELVATVNVREGQTVHAGEVLLTLDATAANARVAQREAELAEANARLAESVKGARSEEIARAEASVALTHANLKDALQQFERAKRLYQDKVASKATLDSAIAAKDAAIAKQTEAQQTLNQLQNGTRSEQLDQARAAVAAAAARLAIEQKALADLTLVVAQDAVVDTLPWRAGDRVAAGTQLVGLLATAQPYVRVYVPATWLDHVAPGNKVLVHVDGREQTLNGVVRTIRSQPAYTPFYALNERDRARLMYLTDVDLGAEGQQLPTGMAVQVELVP